MHLRREQLGHPLYELLLVHGEATVGLLEHSVGCRCARLLEHHHVGIHCEWVRLVHVELSLDTRHLLHLLHVLMVEAPVQICLVQLVNYLLLVLNLLSLQFFEVGLGLERHLG